MSLPVKVKGDNYTFRQTSVIDYTIGTLDVLKLIGQFEIIETDPIFSDGHCILSHSFDSHNLDSAENDRLTGKSPCPKWDASRSEQFCENINLEQIEEILSLLDSNMPDHVRVNEATERIATLFTIASNQTFPVQNKGNFCRKRPWYGPLCRSARTKYHVAKKRFNTYKSSSNRQLLTEASRNYKKKK